MLESLSPLLSGKVNPGVQLLAADRFSVISRNWYCWFAEHRGLLNAPILVQEVQEVLNIEAEADSVAFAVLHLYEEVRVKFRSTDLHKEPWRRCVRYIRRDVS